MTLGTTTSSTLSNQPTGDQRAVTPRQAAINEYNELRETAALLLHRAAKVRGLPSIYAAHAKANAEFADVQMHEVWINPDGDDFRLLEDNVREICRAVDPLMDMIGHEAKEHSLYKIDGDVFKNVLFNAVDGMALHELSEAADRMDEDRSEREDDIADHRIHLAREAAI